MGERRDERVRAARGAGRGEGAAILAAGGGREGGFTLVELLVVIAILGVLLAIMMPSLGRAREMARSAHCRSNIKQIWELLHARSDGMPGSGAWIGYVRGRGGERLLRCPSDSKESGASGFVQLGGNIVEIDPPPSVVFNAVESNTTIHGYLERECFELPQAVAVNITRPGYYNSSNSLSAGSIPAGMVVDCYFLFFDPVGGEDATSSGQVTMGGDVIGIICMDSQLNASDSALGAPGTAYPGGQGSRGFEMGAEVVELKEDMRTFVIHNFHSSFPGEHVRILTMPGGASSYGINNQVASQSPRPDQIMLVDYMKTVVDVDGANYDDDFEQRIAPRHLGKANVLFIDGSVRSLTPEEIEPHSALWKP